MSNQETEVPTKHDATEKERLECEKLKAEINIIQKPMLKTPAFYVAICPMVLAVLGLVFTWATGWFDVQRTRVANDKTLLESQTETLKTERTALDTQTREQKLQLAHSEEQITRLSQREANYTNQIATLSREREELIRAKSFLENETKRLAGSDTNASQFLEQLKSLQVNREQLINDFHTLQSSNVALLNVAAQQSALIHWANEVLSEGWSIALNDIGTWKKFKDFGQDVLAIHTSSIHYLPEWQTLPDLRAAWSEKKMTYEDDLRTEAEKVSTHLTNRNYRYRINEAEKRFIEVPWPKSIDMTSDQK